MSSNLGHEIFLSEIRITVRSLSIRFLISLIAGLLSILVCNFIFGPSGGFLHAADYWGSYLVFKVKLSLPIFHLTQVDVYRVAYKYGLMMKDFWFWEYSLVISGAVALSSFITLSVLFFKKGQRQALEHVMRGNRLLTPKIHNKLMKAEYKKRPPFEMGNSLELGEQKVLLPESLQYLHISFVGASGCGKSTAIEDIIGQVKARKEKALIVDLNGSFYAKYGSPEDHILSLRDPRTERWDFWGENTVEPENLAASMIEATGDSNAFFWKGARAVLASLLRHTKSTHELWEDFKKNTDAIRKKLENKNEISQRIIGSGDSDQSDGILGSTVLDFGFLKELNQWNETSEPKFSITNWINNNNDRSWVYLVVSDKDLEITKPLLRVWFDLACLGCLSRDANNSQNVHTWLIVDELKSIGQLQSLPALLDKGRKYSTSAVLGFQSISQIQKIYGERDAQSILQGMQNQFYFRMNDEASANYASAALGEQELEQVNVGVSFGQGNTQDRGSLNKTATRRRIILPDELKSLRSLQCYAKLGPHSPVKMQFQIQNRKRVNEPSISKINPEYVVGKENPEFKISGTTVVDEKVKKTQKEKSNPLPWTQAEKQDNS